MNPLKQLEAVPRRNVLVVSCVLGLLGLALMFWSLFDSSWIPVLLSMSLGQAIGTLSFGLFILVVVVDLRRAIFRSSIPPSHDHETQ